jgi:hypothetical protein
LDLGREERAAYMEKVGPALDELLAAGVEVVGWGSVEEEPGGHGTGFGDVAVWRMPSRKEVDMLRSLVTEAGWYDYFDQVNAVSELGAPDAVVAEHIGA